ncbi:hypothetical protein MITS9508_00355 [Synechococcus sp. MIT S9508]|nr:hypothetical protein MITS9508_00355 [Synechococcus sp. MIT S9508]
MSTAIHFDAQYGLSDALLLSFLLTGLSSIPVGFVLIMWFDLLPWLDDSISGLVAYVGPMSPRCSLGP